VRRHGGHGVKVGFALGTGGRLELGALDLGAVHALGEKDAVAQKELVVVTAGIGASGQALETVQIELALEGSQFALAKVSVVYY